MGEDWYMTKMPMEIVQFFVFLIIIKNVVNLVGMNVQKQKVIGKWGKFLRQELTLKM